jgi:hypothetical protein
MIYFADTVFSSFKCCRMCFIQNVWPFLTHKCWLRIVLFTISRSKASWWMWPGDREWWMWPVDREWWMWSVDREILLLLDTWSHLWYIQVKCCPNSLQDLWLITVRYVSHYLRSRVVWCVSYLLLHNSWHTEFDCVLLRLLIQIGLNGGCDRLAGNLHSLALAGIL